MKNTTIVKIASYVFMMMSVMCMVIMFAFGGESEVPMSIKAIVIGMSISMCLALVFGWLATKLHEIVFVVDYGTKYVEQAIIKEDIDSRVYYMNDEERRDNFKAICKQISIDPAAPLISKD